MPAGTHTTVIQRILERRPMTPQMMSLDTHPADSTDARTSHRERLGDPGDAMRVPRR